ncbi:MAG: 16S rRNA (uracil(1498)-N(3))-methyltransferase [Clostridia bacterium]|nr:16S rRNA (uracil(1498)-N(3))-methyltransferase [Clostridia bacterium]
MNRFFVEPKQIQGNTVWITGEDVKHIGKVLRLDSGDQVMVCDGTGLDYLCSIVSLDKDAIRLSILQSLACKTEPHHKVTLYQGLPKAGKMELLIQKCVELGVWAIVPVYAQRSVVKLNSKEFESKLVRYQRVAYEAAKQARRGIIPQVASLAASYQDVDMRKHDLLLIADEDEQKTSLREALRMHGDAKDIALVIGPEGGLDRGEVAALQKKGGLCVSLGPRIMRTETAGMAALSMLLYELGDME